MSIEVVLRERIQKQGALPFDEYMALALYHPQFGYYNTQVDFSRDGDFITAPTLTPLFSETLAHFLAPMLMQEAILELGPGNGQLAYDLLLALDTLKKLPTAYYLVEVSPHLQLQQKKLLAKLPVHLQQLIRWVSLNELHDLKAIVLANEFFDALPVLRFKINHDVQECYVDMIANQLTEVLHAPRADLVAAIAPLNLPEGYASEFCFAYGSWARDLFRIMREGLLLIIDYGYPEREYYQINRTQGTLQGYYQHQAIKDYLAYPGQMDLTAHVNFSHLSKQLLAAGFNFEFFTYQNVFLLDQGINEHQRNHDVSMAQKLKRLLDPRLMGEHFKILAFSKNSALAYKPTYELAKFL